MPQESWRGESHWTATAPESSCSPHKANLGQAQRGIIQLTNNLNSFFSNKLGCRSSDVPHANLLAEREVN